MSRWPLRSLLNVVYALLAERADALDRAEAPLLPYASDEKRDSLMQHREQLDLWLHEPMGRQAAAEEALMRALRG